MKKINLYKDGEIVAFVMIHPSQIDRADIWLRRVCMLATRWGISYQYSIEEGGEG